MGGCFSKKDFPSHPIPKAIASQPPKENAGAEVAIVAVPAPAPAPPAAKIPVSAVAKPTKKSSASSQDVDSDISSSKKGETPKKKAQQERGKVDDGLVQLPAPAPAPAAAAVRSSNCSRDEVDAILIQCGHLSRSSSGKTTTETSGHHRRYSGSKRSYDFDEEERKRPDGDEEMEKQVSRPSPRRRTPARDGGGGEHKRSGSREKGNGSGGGGGRRVSRSPGRRTDDSGSTDSSKQPAKMVLVPARERGSSSSAAMEANVERAKTNSADSSRPRSHSMRRSRSPANSRCPSNENSSSHQSLKKTDQSPHRRTPMAELDKNASKTDSHHHHHQYQRKPSTQGKPQKPSQGIEPSHKLIKETTLVVKGAVPLLDDAQRSNPRSSVRTPSRNRTSSGDFDISEGWGKSNSQTSDSHIVSLNPGNPSSHNSFIYYNGIEEDASFSPPACVSKARSILEAVAGLNSSFSDNRRLGGKRREEPFTVSEIGVEEDLMEPSLHKYVTVRNPGGEMDPQESAGSNNIAGQSWEAASSPWGHKHNFIDSSADRCWTSRSNNNEGGEFEEEDDVPPPDFDHLKLARRSLPAASSKGL